MRIKRSFLLWPVEATVHLFWRCHNREFYLDKKNIKELYFKCLADALDYKSLGKNCKIHAFCAMGNHFHQCVSYFNGSTNLSNFMRYAHSLFGARYNKLTKRSGKVAEGRPKTPRIQDPEHQMRVHFYVEANPIRAGIKTLKTLSSYIYSSYPFYAYGKKSEFTKLLSIPEWYLALGKTATERQRKYRTLFANYLGADEINDPQQFHQRFIGNLSWIDRVTSFLSSELKRTDVTINDLRKFDNESNTS